MERPLAALVTGFEPFGGHAVNPSALIASELNRREIAGVRVAGRILPVDLARLDGVLDEILDEVEPVAVIALGLAASEAVIRLERVALNLADFDIPDNSGAVCRDQPLEADGPEGRLSRLPLAAILDALLAAGIPARRSETAGLYLCNAVMYRLLGRIPRPVPCGFIHLPPLPEQIAAALRGGGERGLSLASMPLALQVEAVALAISTTLGPGAREVGKRAREEA